MSDEEYSTSRREFMKKIGIAGVSGAAALWMSASERFNSKFSGAVAQSNPVGASNIDSSDGDVIDVTDHGASGDGNSDDSDAIEAAIEAAGPGDTVYLPEGDYRIDGDPAIRLSGPDPSRPSPVVPENLTITGAGPGTRIISGTHDGTMVRFLAGDGLQGVELRNMVLDGLEQSGTILHFWAMTDDDLSSDTMDVLVEDVLVENSGIDQLSSGISILAPGITLNRVTVRNVGQHAIGIRTRGRNNVTEPWPEVHNSLAEGVGRGGNGYAMYASWNSAIFENSVMRDVHQGFKVQDGTDNVEYRNIRIQNAEEAAVQRISSSRDSNVLIENMVIENANRAINANGRDDWTLPDDSKIVSVDSGDRSGSDISFGITSSLDANNAEIHISNPDNNRGLRWRSSSQGSLGALQTEGVGNPVDNNGNLDIGETGSSPARDIDNVPTADEVGAWSDAEIDYPGGGSGAGDTSDGTTTSSISMNRSTITITSESEGPSNYYIKTKGPINPEIEESDIQDSGSSTAGSGDGGSASHSIDVDPSDDDVIDVTADPYNAEGDGSEDDTDAIQQAIDSASDGDVVYFPAGTYLFSRPSHGSAITIDKPPENLRLIGDGPETELRYMGGGQDDNHRMFIIRGGAKGFEMHNMVFNGNKNNFSGDPNTNPMIRIEEGDPGNQSYLFNNLILENNYTGGLLTRTHGVTISNCTVRNNGGHGINIGTHHDDPDNSENRERITVQNCYVHGNGKDRGRHYGIDHAYGDFEIIDTVIEDNEQGSKTSSASDWVRYPDWAPDGIHRRTRFIDNDINPYQSTNADESGIVRFEDVVVGPGNGESLRLSRHDYVLENVILHQGYRAADDDRITETNVTIGEGDIQEVPTSDEVGAFVGEE